MLRGAHLDIEANVYIVRLKERDGVLGSLQYKDIVHRWYHSNPRPTTITHCVSMEFSCAVAFPIPKL